MHSKDNTNRHFKGQQRNEKLVYFTRKHWITLLGVIAHGLATTVAVGAGIYFVFTAGPQAKATLYEFKWAIMGGVIGLTIWYNYLFIRFMNYFLDVVIVTNFRIINLEKSLYLQNNRDVVDLHEIQDIKKIQHGILPNLLKYGKLIVIVPTMIEPMTLPSIPHPDKFFRKVNNSKRDYIHHRQQQRLEAISGHKVEQPKYDNQALSRAG